jgi:hypothetical protein
VSIRVRLAAVNYLVSDDVVGDNQKTGVSLVGVQRLLRLRSYKTAWAWLHKLRRGWVRP